MNEVIFHSFHLISSMGKKSVRFVSFQEFSQFGMHDQRQRERNVFGALLSFPFWSFRYPWVKFLSLPQGAVFQESDVLSSYT